MKPLRFAALSGGRAPLPFVAIALSIAAVLAVFAGAACGSDDEEAAKGFIGTSYPDPPRLGSEESDAGNAPR